jgi:hypothetical protein
MKNGCRWQLISVTPSLCLSVKSIGEAVSLCIPDTPHRNNSALFRLARALLSLKKQAPISKSEELSAFDSWYELAAGRGVLRPEQARDDYLVEFMNALNKAKFPLGEGPAEHAWKLAQSAPPPPEASVFQSVEGKLLVGCCYQLHVLSNGEPWFLSARMAATLTGRSHTQIATWLSALVQLGILKIVEQHTASKATRYQYVSQS